MEFQHTISFDSVIALAGFAGTLTVQWFVLRADVKEVKKDIDALRRGRGLILGANSDWPDAVRRCFGFGQRPRHGD